MKIFELHWKDGKKELIAGNNFEKACKNAGLAGGAISALDHYENVPSLTYKEIATELKLNVMEMHMLLVGLFGNPKLGEGTFVAKTSNTDKNRIPTDQAQNFIEKVKDFLKKGGEINDPRPS